MLLCNENFASPMHFFTGCLQCKKKLQPNIDFFANLQTFCAQAPCALFPPSLHLQKQKKGKVLYQQKRNMPLKVKLFESTCNIHNQVSSNHKSPGVPGFVAKSSLASGGRPVPARHVSPQRRLLWLPGAFLSSVIDAFRKVSNIIPNRFVEFA